LVNADTRRNGDKLLLKSIVLLYINKIFISVKRLVIALGGNALLRKGEKGTLENQFKNAEVTAKEIVDLALKNYKIVVTHGNGPQVGNIYLQQELVADKVPPMALDACGAMSQGLIGYILTVAILNELIKRGAADYTVVTIVTHVIVDDKDPAFKNPSKPIGLYYTEEEAMRILKEKKWALKPDPRGGWRRVVPSPRPLKILEAPIIRDLVERDKTIVIACGGGGIPLIFKDGKLKGVEAVIDKDLTSAKIAVDIKADILLILTDVEKVALNYGKPNQQWIDSMTVSEARRYISEGHFAPGSMLPKVVASIEFVEASGERAIITKLGKALKALLGETGTHIVRG